MVDAMRRNPYITGGDEVEPRVSNMDEITKILRDSGFVVVEGYEATVKAISESGDGATGNLCSGYRVFPDGEKCSGCSDCLEGE